MSSQPPNGRHVTDFAEILHTIWDMKKIPEPEDERSETSEDGLYISNGSNFFILEDGSKNISVLNR